MPEKPKEEKINPKEKPEKGEDSTPAVDPKKRSYYYDDASGYEIYDPEKDDEEEDD